MKAYLAAPIFTERDRNFNSYLEREILKRCPDLDLYLAQNNTSINDKTGCATSADIYVGDITRLKEADLLITIMSGDLPPIGSSYEVAYFCGLCEQDPRRRIVALYDDCREATMTYSIAKNDAMLSGIAENQFPYINLLSIGFVKKWGSIYNTSEELINAVERECKIGFDKYVTGIYKITNLKDGKIYVGQSNDIYCRWREHIYYESSPIYDDVQKIGKDYFKFEIVETCNEDKLFDREAFWIDYYDCYETGYNRTCEKSQNGTINGQSIVCSTYDNDGKIIKTYNSLIAGARDMGMKSTGNIVQSIKGTRIFAKNVRWRYGCEPTIEPYAPKIFGKGEVFVYDYYTRKFITSYPNAKIAAENLGGNSAHIIDVIHQKRRSCLGLVFTREYFDILPIDYNRRQSSYFNNHIMEGKE